MHVLHECSVSIFCRFLNRCGKRKIIRLVELFAVALLLCHQTQTRLTNEVSEVVCILQQLQLEQVRVAAHVVARACRGFSLRRLELAFVNFYVAD